MNYKELIKSSQRNFLTTVCSLDDINLFDSTTNNSYNNVIDCIFKKYYKNSRYNSLLNQKRSISEERCAHIVFTFFLGLFFYKQSKTIQKSIDPKIESVLNNAGHLDDFQFLWFLICLYHDLGYSEENKGVKSKIGYSWTSTHKLGNPFGTPKLYESIYRNYFSYRKTEGKVTDHCIYAGLKMYEDLCKIRKEKKRNNPNPKFWKIELEVLYNFASWVVLAHNIWYVKDTDRTNCDLYRKYHLEKLILKTDLHGLPQKYPILLSEHPVLFLFCLVDTIEPMKRIGCSTCCENIDFEVDEACITITSNLPCELNNIYTRQLLGTNDWLTTAEHVEKKNKTRIWLKPKQNEE